MTTRTCLLVLLTAACGCTAIDSFGFTFASDLSPTSTIDLPPPPPGAFGDPCTPAIGCTTPAGNTHPLLCIESLTQHPFPGGMCTRACDPSSALACTDEPNAGCGDIGNGATVCLPRCNAVLNQNCRGGYACCEGGHMVNSPGLCAPPTSAQCGG